MISQKILPTILDQFALPVNGQHGPAHWARVLNNARRLARNKDVNQEVLELFALFHDSRRITDGLDRDHGRRGADFAFFCRGVLFELPDDDMERLYEACAGHDDIIREHEDLTVRICWDAERLDLARLGIHPRRGRMSTMMARTQAMIDWASNQSLSQSAPVFFTGQSSPRPENGFRI